MPRYEFRAHLSVEAESPEQARELADGFLEVARRQTDEIECGNPMVELDEGEPDEVDW